MDAADNKRLMQEIFARLAEADPTLFLQHLADDVVVTITGENSWSRSFHGKDAARKGLWGYVNSLVAAQGRTFPFRILADEDWVVLEARGDMTTKAGQPYRNHYCLLYRLQDGKIVEMREYQDSSMCERILGPYPAPVPA
ncbi:nuclear transport factor 2 family protein [Phenylobacterium terrae]|uniref:Nuclear transport factor 2 family protein n=1 Tax=Phenylobacterium terrae TaxID=2665495 RepID=A0ABW4N6I6_9CAUL